MPPPSRDRAVPEPASRGSEVLQLRELDLPLPFTRPRPPREDVENELRPIEHLPLHARLDLAQLRRRQLVVEDDHGHVRLVAGRRERVHLAAAEERGGIGLRALLGHAQHDGRPRGVRQAGELVERPFRLQAPGAGRDQTRRSRHVRDAGVCAVVASAGGGCEAERRVAGRTTSDMLSRNSSTRSHATAPGRTSSGGSAVTSTMVEGGPPGAGPASSSRSRPLAARGCRSVRIGRRSRTRAVGARRGDQPARRQRQCTRDDRSGTRTPTSRLSLCTAGARRASALTSSVSGPGQK